jgi:hypothetical protein
LAGLARYLSVLGVLASTNIESRYEDRSGFGPGAWIALVGCVLLTAAALLRIAVNGEERDSGPILLPRLLVLGGAALGVVATMVPFTTADLNAQTVLERTTNWHAVEPILTAVFAVALTLVLGWARAEPLIALGVFLGLLWASRYIAFSAWQVNDAASIALGGFLGLAGGVAILLGGLRVRPPPAGYSVRVVPTAPSRR